MSFPTWTVLAFAWALSLPASASADRCGDLATPVIFDEHTAMQAVICEYNRDMGGTLLPPEHTAAWNLARAETLATPMLAATYRERGTRKGVLVVQRQMLYEGEPAWGHAQTAVVSVYVFSLTGKRWTIERHAEETLVTTGPDRFGLWFVGGDMGQGYTFDYAYLVPLSDGPIAEAGRFELGASNSGACSDDPKERDTSIHACWSWETTAEFVRVPGRANDLLRLTAKGNESADQNDVDRITAKTDVVCYARSGGTYAAVNDPTCGGYRGVARADSFDVGETPTGAKPQPR
jgi:hypothetical protein